MDRLGDYARGQLRILSASCRHQQVPGAPKPRKYVAVCQAKITMPRQPTTSLPTPGGMPYTIETWNITGGGMETGILVRRALGDV